MGEEIWHFPNAGKEQSPYTYCKSKDNKKHELRGGTSEQSRLFDEMRYFAESVFKTNHRYNYAFRVKDVKEKGIEYSGER